MEKSELCSEGSRCDYLNETKERAMDSYEKRNKKSWSVRLSDMTHLGCVHWIQTWQNNSEQCNGQVRVNSMR